MKKEKKKTEPVIAEPAGNAWWTYGLGFLLLAFFVFEIYQPMLKGPFVFDDSYLPMLMPNGVEQPFTAWISGLRPVLMASYWGNTRLSGLEPSAFKLWNIWIHLCSAILVWLWARKLIQRLYPDQIGNAVSVFVALIFLLHPLQTESVSYVAGRSESLSGLLFLGAFVTFLYHGPQAIGWLRALCVLLLFGAALLTKEHTAVFPLLLLLTDYFFYPGFSLEGIRKNWRVYLLIALGAIAGVFTTFRLLLNADSAGFRLKEFTWYQYFFTQCRSIVTYMQLFLFPVGQNVDHEQAISYTFFDHGTPLALLALLILLVGAWLVRKRFPLACYGVLVFLLLLAPTSSVIPIKDTLVERRMYLPLIGLCLVVAQFLLLLRIPRAAMLAIIGTVSLAAGYTTYVRNHAWSSTIALWTDSAAKSPQKARPAFQIAYAQYEAGNCIEAVNSYAKVAQLEKPDYRLYADWALAADCAGRYDEALEKLRLGLALEDSAHVHATMGMILAKQGKSDEALTELQKSETLDASFAMVRFYRGNVYMQRKEYGKAIESYNQAVHLDPKNQTFQRSLAMAQRQGKE